ncbi:MAG: DMT family transporter, partial [Chloroflexota bacterium]|nr:DMT family transporter [Chloroflexota bacterium]
MKRPGAADLLLVCVSVIWGLNFTAVKWALKDIQPVAQIGFRMALSTAIFFLALRIVEGKVGVKREYWRRLGLIGLIGLAVNQVCFVVGLRFTTAVNSTLICATSPVYGLLLAGRLNGERVGARQFVGLATAFAGVLAVIAAGDGLGG